MPKVAAKRATKATKAVKRNAPEAPIPFRPTADAEPRNGDALDRILRMTADELGAKDREIAALRAKLAVGVPPPKSLRNANGDVLHEPDDESVFPCARSWIPLAEVATERAVFSVYRNAVEHQASLGHLLLDKLSCGHSSRDGHGVVRGAMRTVLGGLELVRAMADNQIEEEVDADLVQDLLHGLRELGKLAIEVEERAIRANADVAADLARQSKAVAS